MKRTVNKKLCLISLILLVSSSSTFSQERNRIFRIAEKKLSQWTNPVTTWPLSPTFKPDSIDITGHIVNIYFPVSLSYMPIRENSNSAFVASLKNSLGRKFRNYDIQVFTNNFETDQLIPNIFRKNLPADTTRLLSLAEIKPQLISRIDLWRPSSGLNSENIALWHSHGYYFDQPLDRWEWQRAKIFGTVEDVSVMGYVLPYLTPMLEKAGATVFLPRERDTQVNEVIVDNDLSSGNSEFVLHLIDNDVLTGSGFLLTDTLFQNMNPFRMGTSLRVKNGSSVYVPEFSERGEYAVYISYPYCSDNSKSVKYTVNHSGGSTGFTINQTIGGSTWIYLGTFLFNKGKNDLSGSVAAEATDGGFLALDAVRFGGGMGNVARRPSAGFIPNQWSLNENSSSTDKTQARDETTYKWIKSGKPRYLEGARYFLQYAGMPDSLVYSQNFYRNDYNDDYQSRGEWVNYLTGSPVNPDGSNGNQKAEGLGLPIDLAFAFHTDAGVTPDTSIIGTLGIYSTAAGEGKYPDGVSRMAARDLTDIIQTQIVDDISEIYNINWSRRGLWDKSYSEARKPNVPVMLLELLSHQNKADQQYGLDPRFRFNVCRSIYKGMLKFLAYNENREYVVAPLPVTHFAITHLNGKSIRLSWKPTVDPLEPSAESDRYRLCKRIGDNGFDNGVIVEKNVIDIELGEYNTIYSFKVTALNAGGESFDSEVLAAGFTESDSTGVLVVNAFDRISGPAWFDKDGMAGVAWWDDRGVADHYDIVAVGDQYDFDRNSPWIDDDAPGWGASYSDKEGSKIPGNTFDFPYIHGKALMNAGRSFFSVSDEVFCNPEFNTETIRDIDIIFGEEKTTLPVTITGKKEFSVYTPEYIHKIETLVGAGKNIFISGAFIGSELINSGDTVALKFAADYLHFKPRTGHAVKTGSVYSTDYSFPYFKDSFTFNTGSDQNVYGVEAPDAIEPADKQSVTAFRYSENNTSAGVIFKGNSAVCILGFPFETITSENDRNILMKQIMDFFNK